MPVYIQQKSYLNFVSHLQVIVQICTLQECKKLAKNSNIQHVLKIATSNAGTIYKPFHWVVDVNLHSTIT